MIKFIINESLYEERGQVGDLRRHYNMIGSSTEIFIGDGSGKAKGIIILYIDDEPKNHYVYNPKEGVEYHIVNVCVNARADNFNFDLSDKHFENHILIFHPNDDENEIINTIDANINAIKEQIELK